MVERDVCTILIFLCCINGFQAFPGMMQYKRAGGDKTGMPVFQQNSGAYQQLLQPFVPTVSCEYCDIT